MYKRLGRVYVLFLALLSFTADAAFPWDKDQQELQEIRVVIDERTYVFHVQKNNWCQPTVVVDKNEVDFGCDASIDYLRAVGKLERFIHDKCPEATQIQYTETFRRTGPPPDDLAGLRADDLLGEWEGQGRYNTVVAHFLRDGTVIWFNSPRALAAPNFSNSISHQWELATGARPAIGLWTPKDQQPDPIAKMFPGLPSSARLGPNAFADYSEIVKAERSRPYCRGPRIDHLTLAQGEAIPEVRRSNRQQCGVVVAELRNLMAALESGNVPPSYLKEGAPLLGEVEQKYGPYRTAYLYLTRKVIDLGCRNFDSGVGHYPKIQRDQEFRRVSSRSISKFHLDMPSKLNVIVGSFRHRKTPARHSPCG